MTRPPPPIGQLLIARGMITAAQLDEGLDAQTDEPDRPLVQILAGLGHVEEAPALRVLAESIGVAFETLSPEMVNPDAIDCLPRTMLDADNLLPLSALDGALRVAVESFADVYLIDDIRRVAGSPVEVVAATPANIRDTRERVLGDERAPTPTHDAPEDALDGILGQIGIDELRVVDETPEHDADLEATASGSPVVKLVNYIIKSAVQQRASDIHVEPAQDHFRVRFRVDGDLVESIRPSIRLLPAVVSRFKILSGMDISERRLPQDGGVTVTLFDRSVDLRLSTMAGKFGETVVVRIADREAELPKLDAIGMREGMARAFRASVAEPNGVVLVTGPTGSGKSTTLYAALAEIADEKRNVSTIEDPVERVVPGVNQFQISPKLGFGFAGALRSMLRQDPDVIMVGEIRDSETAQLATEAALTGHLVLSTLHTNDAPSAAPRLANMGVEPYLIAATLRAVLAQRLVRRICAHCARPTQATPTQHQTLARLLGEDEFHIEASEGAGCARCGLVGSRGRAGVFDLVRHTENALASVTDAEAVVSARRRGQRGLLLDGLAKVNAGEIAIASLLEILAGVDPSATRSPTTRTGARASA